MLADGSAGGLLQVPAVGGAPVPLTELNREDGEASHRLPHFLPGGNAVLFTVMRGDRWNDAEIVARSLETGDRKVLIKGGADPRYVPTGHLVFVREGVLMAVPFDPVRLETSGDPVRVLEDVMQACFTFVESVDTGAAQISFSALGDLAYVPGGVNPWYDSPLLWVDGDGVSEVIDTGSGNSLYPRISPDGRYLAFLKGLPVNSDLWVYDIERGGPPRRLTDKEEIESLAWSPDSERIAFGSYRSGSVHNLYTVAADGTGDIERLTTRHDDQYVESWSPDGVLAFVQENDIWVLRMDEEGKGVPELFLESRFTERFPAFSPDGRWLAYRSNSTGRSEVWVQPYPGPGVAIPISTEGGTAPAWSQNGRELFYRQADSMMAVEYEVKADGEFEHGTPRKLFEESYISCTPTYA